MLTWFAENIATILICALLLCVVFGIVFHLIQNKRKGKSSCGCGCSSCAMKGSCHGGKS